MTITMTMTSIDHSHDDNDDEDDDNKNSLHSQLMDGVLWVLVGLLFVGATPCSDLYCVYCGYCEYCVVYIVGIVRLLLVGFGDVASFYPFSRHINQLSNTK